MNAFLKKCRSALKAFTNDLRAEDGKTENTIIACLVAFFVIVTIFIYREPIFSFVGGAIEDVLNAIGFYELFEKPELTYNS